LCTCEITKSYKHQATKYTKLTKVVYKYADCGAAAGIESSDLAIRVGNKFILNYPNRQRRQTLLLNQRNELAQG